MAKKNVNVESILEVVSTGLDGEDLVAFKGFMAAELGAIKAGAGDDVFAGLKLTGKGDKAKGTYNGARVEFKGGHNAALRVIHFGCILLKEADSLGILPPVVDMSPTCKAWASKRAGKKEVVETSANPAIA